MSRRRAATKREVLPDHKYKDITLTKFMNRIMQDGKKSVSEQIVIIYAGINGFLDDIEIDNINDYENQLLEYFSAKHEDLLSEIQSSGKLSEELEKNLSKGITDFNKGYSS